MASGQVSSPIVRWSARLLASVAMVGAVTGVVALLKPHVPALNLLVLYLLAVLPVAVLWGARLAAVMSVFSITVFALLLSSGASVLIADSRNVVALGVFLVTAVVVAELAARSRRSAVESARLTKEQSALRRVATLVAQSGPPREVFEAVTREVGLLCGADLARMERYEPDGTVTGVAAWSLGQGHLAVETQFDLGGLSVARDVKRTGGPVQLETFAGASGTIAREARALGIRASVGCPVVVAGRLWGVIAASTKGDTPFPANTELQIASFTELVATAVENAESRAELRRLADEQAALRRVATLVANGVASDLVFAAVAHELNQLTDAEITGIFRFESDGMATLMGSRGFGKDELRVGERLMLPAASAIASVQATGQSARHDEDAELQRLPESLRGWEVRSAVASPIIVEGRCWGGIGVASRRSSFPAATERRMVEFTEIAATAIANAESRAQLMASRGRVVAAGDEMRRRLERDLHDGAQQRLVSLALELRFAGETVPPELPVLRTVFAQAAEDLTEVLEELREMSRGLHPAILAEGGLGPALRTLARRSAVSVELKVETESRYPTPVEVATYYVVSEALTNTSKHAAASHAEVILEERADTLWLRIRDDGVGGAEPQGGSGLVGLRDRVEALGGSIDVVSPVGHGTVMEVSLPIKRTDNGGVPGGP
ncbi:GAF domain-containing protein [Kribbella orskensis]|uniref:histidine kinase n=1 Tax=Kribbella orskensis TaxID=2512216 RepID=A0ABY2BMC9_9ACTN|nr:MULTISPECIES: GAF domain-containing protein [Kribbella]TCN41664.1 GAF domain-containing protein [Kribbella sp. VKM Ac-2500]TCO25542.1 GAF domain-containing protein [Kribbella orskensis]